MGVKPLSICVKKLKQVDETNKKITKILLPWFQNFCELRDRDVRKRYFFQEAKKVFFVCVLVRVSV